jgi:hypothetical protein
MYQALFHGRISFEFWVVGLFEVYRKEKKKELPTNHHCVTVLTANSAEINSLLMGPTSTMNESTAKRGTVHFSESAHKLPRSPTN